MYACVNVRISEIYVNMASAVNMSNMGRGLCVNDVYRVILIIKYACNLVCLTIIT